ncbi:uncharacterized protein LOC126890430 [Diabrotica virgifera virgifera]|uniref:DUF7869 domain-containing protein n=1 Tax=Diabrotica virgifera virgifera TaxID=50390 RepID=A0ABM5KYP0_DIAVI|nr:uncharacterized protein LOC126890430 [Diabrotica virgifera virgifera]
MENRLSVEKSNQKMSRAQRIIESALKQISQDDVSQSYNETAVNNKIEIYDDATQTSGSTELAAPDLTAESQNDMSSNSAMQEEIITSCDDDYVDNTSEDENWEPLSKKSKQRYYNRVYSSDSEDTDTSSDRFSSNINKNCNASTHNVVISSSDSDIAETPKKRVRKRFRNELNWKKTAAKIKRNSGSSYINSSGKTIEAKSLKPPCSINCRLKCTEKINNQERQIIFNNFYALQDLTRQRDWIVRNIKKVQPKYRYTKEGSKRSYNNNYFFECNGSKIQVCRHFFLNTLDISKRTVSTALEKCNNEGFIEGERRGKHGKHIKLDDNLLQGMFNFINAIPRIESHYLRNQTTREYIDGGKTLSDLHRDYKLECQQNKKLFGNYTAFRKTFLEKFNISFFIPKKDNCSTCEQYKNCPENEEFKLIYDAHLEVKEQAREEKRIDSLRAKNKECVTAAFDLQAVLPTPCGDASLFYYKRRLSTLNFTVYDIGNATGFCYVWNEAQARRGSNEIGSCLLYFLQNNCQNRDVIFYSDNCPGQNKNQTIPLAFLYAVEKFNVNSITHKFLPTGHTQNEGDMVHSLIEKQKKLALRSGTISVPAQWITVIQTAKKNGNPLKVQELSTEDVKDIKQMMGNKSNFSKNTLGETVKWKEISVVRVERGSPFHIFYKYNFKDEFKVLDIREKKRGRQAQLKLKPAYNDPPGISSAKKQDLLSLCTSNIINKQYHNFYESLPISNSVDTNNC